MVQGSIYLIAATKLTLKHVSTLQEPFHSRQEICIDLLSAHVMSAASQLMHVPMISARPMIPELRMNRQVGSCGPGGWAHVNAQVQCPAASAVAALRGLRTALESRVVPLGPRGCFGARVERAAYIAAPEAHADLDAV